MITLILVFCLASDPTSCREESYRGVELEFCEGIRPQLLAAEWLAEHADGWTFAGHRCEIEVTTPARPT